MWLLPEKQVGHFHLESGAKLQFKIKRRPLRIRYCTWLYSHFMCDIINNVHTEIGSDVDYHKSMGASVIMYYVCSYLHTIRGSLLVLILQYTVYSSSQYS